jgi:hypothetical protein
LHHTRGQPGDPEGVPGGDGGDGLHRPEQEGRVGLAAQGSLIDLVGVSFFPLYKVVGPMIFFLSLLVLIWGGLRLIITVCLRVIIIVRYKGCGIWV